MFGHRDHDAASGASDQVVLQKSWDSIVGTSEADIRSDSVLYSSTVYSGCTVDASAERIQTNPVTVIAVTSTVGSHYALHYR